MRSSKLRHVVENVRYLNTIAEGLERPVKQRELRKHLRLLVDLYRSCPQRYSWQDVMDLISVIDHYFGPVESNRAAERLSVGLAKKDTLPREPCERSGLGSA